MGGNGARMKKEPWMANERTLAQHIRLLGEIGRPEYGNRRVYDIDTLSAVRHAGGYQVILPNIFQYSPEEYADVVNRFLKYVPDHVANVTKGDEVTDISFHIEDKRMAMKLARWVDQHRMFDWATDRYERTERRR